MRTRLLPILCVLALLLSACTADGKPSATTASEPVSGPTDETAAPTVPPTEPAPDPSGSVTPGGWQVYTDPSAYRPAEGALYTRPTGVDLREFHPENASGRVYPYYTDTLYEDTGDGQSWACGHHAGFVDETGTIVTDGVYSSISVLFDGLNEYDPYAESPRLPLWRTGQLESVTVVDEGEYTYPVGEIRYGVVAMDGSFSIPCEYVGIQPFSDRFLCNRSWDKPDFLVFDLSGNVLITSRELIPGKCDWCHVSYTEGLYLVCSGLRDGTEEYRFVDESGTPVLGPYRFANVFHGALAVRCHILLVFPEEVRHGVHDLLLVVTHLDQCIDDILVLARGALGHVLRLGILLREDQRVPEGQDDLLRGLRAQSGNLREEVHVTLVQGRDEIAHPDAGEYLHGLLGADSADLNQLQEKTPLLFVGKTEESHSVFLVLEPRQKTHVAALGALEIRKLRRRL